MYVSLFLCFENAITSFLKELWLTHSNLSSHFILLLLKHLYISNIAFWLKPQKTDSFVKHQPRSQTVFSMRLELKVLKLKALKS